MLHFIYVLQVSLKHSHSSHLHFPESVFKQKEFESAKLNQHKSCDMTEAQTYRWGHGHKFWAFGIATSGNSTGCFLSWALIRLCTNLREWKKVWFKSMWMLNQDFNRQHHKLYMSFLSAETLPNQCMCEDLSMAYRDSDVHFALEWCHKPNLDDPIWCFALAQAVLTTRGTVQMVL